MLPGDVRFIFRNNEAHAGNNGYILMKFNMSRKAQFARWLSGLRWCSTIRIKFPIKQQILIYIAQAVRFCFCLALYLIHSKLFRGNYFAAGY